MSKARNLSKVIVDSSGIVNRDSLDVETVAKTGSYNDLTNKPTIPSGTVTSVAATGGTGISVSGSPITSSGTLTITNTAPDQTVVLTQGGTTTISGTYPNFTISSADQYVGTVTSVAATVPTGLSVSGSPVTSSGTLAISYASGYSIPTDVKQSNWDTAYGWGNHASAGYATYPSQTGNSGKYLTTNGSTTSWATVDALPSQTGNSGKYLTTDGSTASWATINVTPALDDLSDVTIESVVTGQVLSYNGSTWVNTTATSNTTSKGLFEHSNTISADYSITSGNNAMTAGPITINTGVTVTVPTGSTWVIV